MALTGDQLHTLVQDYAGLGIHRAGAAVDAATVEWMRGHLVDRGLDVRAEAVPFDRWVYSSELTVDGSPVDHLPVFYEWTGSVATDRVLVAAYDPKSGGYTVPLEEQAIQARDAGHEALVLATAHPGGALVAINRKPEPGSGFPTVLVAGRDLDRLDQGTVRLELEARLEPGETTNLIATNSISTGPDSAPPLLLTTPLTGWFTCAGERGTGVAVILDLIDRCAHLPLLVIATGGHELDYLGVRRWVAKADIEPAAIVHVGASVAVDAPIPDGTRQLIPTRLAMTSLDGTEAQPVVDALAPIGLTPHTGTERWLGESEVFCELGVPMLSFTGSGLDFHTPEDTPERATSPASLAAVAKAIGEASLALFQSTGWSNPSSTS